MIADEILKTDFVKIGKNETVSRLIGKLKKTHHSEAVVVDKKKFVGVVSKRKMLKSRMRASETKVSKLSVKVSVLNGGENLERVAKLMAASDVHILPVVEKGMLKGVVHAIDVIKEISGSVEAIKAFAAFGGKIIAFDEDTEIGKVMNVMHLKKIDRAPIVDGRSKLVGIVSITDLFTKYSIFPMKRPGGKNIRGAKSSPGKERDMMCLPISNEMNHDVVSAEKDTRIKKIISIMDKKKVSDVILVNDFNEPIGIVTMKNLLKLF